MKQKMILLLFLYCSSLFSAVVYENQTVYGIGKTVLMRDSVPVQEAIRVVENFYSAYMANGLSGQHPNDLIKKQYLTKRLIEKLERVTLVTGADPVMRTQDFSKDAIKSLKVRHVEGDWFIVDYKWNVNDDTIYREIPLKVIPVDGQYKIDYIVPEWDGSLYGDTLLCEDMLQHTVDNSSPQSMLETFYVAYTFMYNSMPEGLFPQLEALRKAHLTPKALNQFNKAAINMYELDKVTNYDVLIDGFDFDCLWIPSITYVPLNESTFKVSYVKWETLITTVTIGIIEIDGEYKINSIRLGN